MNDNELYAALAVPPDNGVLLAVFALIDRAVVIANDDTLAAPNELQRNGLNRDYCAGQEKALREIAALIQDWHEKALDAKKRPEAKPGEEED